MKNSNNFTFVDNTKITFNGLCSNPSTTFDVSSKIFSEEVLNDYIILPSDKIPIKQISKVDISNNILNYKVIETPGRTNNDSVANHGKKRITGKKLSVFGAICLDITYTANDIAGTNEKFSGKLPFTLYIVLPKTIFLTDIFDLSCCVQDVKIISIENSSILNLSASITVSAKKNSDPKPVVAEPSTCSCAGSNSLVTIGTTPRAILRNLIASNDKLWNEISFSKNLILPKNFPNAKSVTSISSSIKIISQKVIATPEVQNGDANLYGQSILGKKLTINLMLKQRITYIADNETSSSHSLIINTPISSYIIIPKTTDLNQKYEIDSYIEDLHSCAIDARTLFTGAILFFKAIEENCTPIKINRGCSCCNSSNNFDIQYNINSITCNLKAIVPIVPRGTWGEATVSRRINAIENAPINFIENVSYLLNVTSIEIIKTANSNNNTSQEGLQLTGLICSINGYLNTNITYNSKNTNNSVVGINVNIPFSSFIVISEEPTSSSKLILNASCIENFHTAVLDENGIGVFAQLFFMSRIIPKTN